MRRKKISNAIVTSRDALRLRKLLDRTIPGARDQDCLARLEDELESADEFKPESVPADVITVNSRVCIQDPDTGTDRVYTLVWPGDADIGSGKISIIAPMGIALFGQRVGEVIEVKAPAGLKKLRVKEILYQPEAAGHYHL